MGGGTMFEIDPFGALVDTHSDDDKEFDQQEVFKQLNYECNDVGGESDSSSDEGVVRHITSL